MIRYQTNMMKRKWNTIFSVERRETQMMKFPAEFLEKEKVYMPYMVGCHLENAPPEAVQAHKENMEWIRKNND